MCNMKDMPWSVRIPFGILTQEITQKTASTMLHTEEVVKKYNFVVLLCIVH